MGTEASVTTWTPIAKGDRRPEGRVLVTCDFYSKSEKKLLAALCGDDIPMPPAWSVEIAYWSPQLRRWIGNGRSIENVIAWAPLPEPYEVEQ